MSWQSALSWLVAACCSLSSVRLLARLRRLDAPEPAALLRELLEEFGPNAELSEFVRRCAIADLNRRLRDVSFELGLIPARFTALTRISLASGMALALFGYIGTNGNSLPPIERVWGFVACAAGGLFGAACVQSVGRMAKQRSTIIRETWDRTSREAGKALGTSLESAADEKKPGRLHADKR